MSLISITGLKLMPENKFLLKRYAFTLDLC
nr:MAG TPA: hypothetical protein [Caudoviricetes sp.]